MINENEIVVKSISCSGKRLDIDFECGTRAQQYFKKNKFFCEYETDISDVGQDILIVPFVANVLPVLWISNLKIKLDAIDKSFYNCIDGLRQSYIKMFPSFKFADNVIQYTKLVENSWKNKNELVLFSGGIDAYNTLINVKNDKTNLFTVIGADIPLDKPESIKVFKDQIDVASRTFNVSKNFCYTNFKDFLNYGLLNKEIKSINDNYWHAFQHGIGIICLAAPLCKKLSVGNVYIASSFSVQEMAQMPNLTCASHPSIDNLVKFGGVSVFHNGIEYNRIDKVKNICNYVKQNNLTLPIHVCWEDTSAKNCCHCEKCFRTIMQICALGIVPPQRIGFNVTPKTFRKFKRFITYKSPKLTHELVHYRLVQQTLSEKSFYYKNNAWLKKYNLDKFNKSFRRNFYWGCRNVYRFAKKCVKKCLFISNKH